MEVKVSVGPAIFNPTKFSNLEVSQNPGVYRHHMYPEQFLLSLNEETVLHITTYNDRHSISKWGHLDNVEMWVKEDRPLTITFKGDN